MLQAPPWSIPISRRPLALPLVHCLLFTVSFNSFILVIYSFLLLTYPVRLVGGPRTKVWHQKLGKRLFGKCLVVVTSWYFRDLDFVISRDDRNKRDENETDWIERDSRGRVTRVKIPPQSVWIANHQTLADWLFLWTFFYLTGSSPSLYIALKSSLSNIPVIGQACRWFGFAFLERNWNKDKVNFERQLDGMAKDTLVRDEARGQLDFLLFPEGTIVTENTRGISSRYAEKAKLKDLDYTLLPRSTGLFFALRQLAVRVPTLELTDLTVGYPLPRHSPLVSSLSSETDHRDSAQPVEASKRRKPLFPSEYYSLPSIFLSKVPPPEIHFHFRSFKLNEIPLGDLSFEPSGNERQVTGQLGMGDGTEEERRRFDEWLLERWREKDDLLRKFNETGSFVEEPHPSRSRRSHEGREEDEEEGEEEECDERVQGEVGWKPRLTTPVFDTIQFVGLTVFVLVMVGWGLPFVWKSIVLRGVSRLLSTSSTSISPSTFDSPSMKIGCGCNKMEL